MYLAFFVQYAVDAHRGKGPRGREFPPHEVRLRGGLVRSWALEGKPEEATKALEWLETLPPPGVLAPRVLEGNWRTRVAYVPPHDLPQPPGHREKVPLLHHVLPLPGRLLAYAYPLEGREEEAEAQLPTLGRLAGRISYLGTSRNLVWVEARLVEDPLGAYREEAGLAFLSVKEILDRLGPLPEVEEKILFPGPLGAFYYAIGVIPDPTVADSPYWAMVQIAHGLPYTAWALERLWPEPPLTRRRATLRVLERIAAMTEEEWEEVVRLVGEPLPSEITFSPEYLYHLPVPRHRQELALSLVDAIWDGPGETYTPPEAGLPEEVVAGMIVKKML